MTGVIYEVNLDIDASIADDYRSWLRDHVTAIVALPGFMHADVFAVTDPPPGRLRLCTHYHVRDMGALLAYFERHAPAMRADGIARFGDRFSATRRILEPLKD